MWEHVCTRLLSSKMCVVVDQHNSRPTIIIVLVLTWALASCIMRCRLCTNMSLRDRRSRCYVMCLSCAIEELTYRPLSVQHLKWLILVVAIAFVYIYRLLFSGPGLLCDVIVNITQKFIVAKLKYFSVWSTIEVCWIAGYLLVQETRKSRRMARLQ